MTGILLSDEFDMNRQSLCSLDILLEGLQRLPENVRKGHHKVVNRVTLGECLRRYLEIHVHLNLENFCFLSYREETSRKFSFDKSCFNNNYESAFVEYPGIAYLVIVGKLERVSTRNSVLSDSVTQPAMYIMVFGKAYS